MSETAVPPSLPDFDNPPVVETILGVEFEPIERWAVPHYGLLWREVSDEYPHFEVHAPLGSQIERFGADANRPELPELTLLTNPQARCLFFHSSKTRLLQVQHDRFIHNWRKTERGSAYPRYDNAIRPVFEREWKRFVQFLRQHEMKEPVVRQCEVTYVNHIERGSGWETPADIPNVVPYVASARTATFLPAPEGVTFHVRYRMPRDQGRLHIFLQPAIRHADLAEVLQLTLTARGRPQSPDLPGILSWLDLGREWVVRGFTDVTSPSMHARWGRRDVS